MFKIHFSFIALFLVHSSLSKPAPNYLTEGRGIGSTVWGWITYPFSWWSSSSEILPVNDQLVGAAPHGPNDKIESMQRNVTVSCNDQTCTTITCDKFGCKNRTCIIYDTDMKGECRQYNTILNPQETVASKPTDVFAVHINEKEIESTKAPQVMTSASISSIQINENEEKTPLQLNAMLLSTVNNENAKKGSTEVKCNRSSSPQNKTPTEALSGQTVHENKAESSKASQVMTSATISSTQIDQTVKETFSNPNAVLSSVTEDNATKRSPAVNDKVKSSPQKTTPTEALSGQTEHENKAESSKASQVMNSAPISSTQINQSVKDTLSNPNAVLTSVTEDNATKGI